MTRTRNGAILGTYDYDADADAPIFARVLREITQDLHMLYDAVTGQNSPANPPAIQVLNHSGAIGSGALLGMTSWQQMVLVYPEISDADLAVYGGSIVILAKPHFICNGETMLVVEVDASADMGDAYCDIYDASGAIIFSQHLSRVAEVGIDELGTWGTIFQFTTTGVQTYVVIRRTYDTSALGFSLTSWRGYAGRVGDPVSGGSDGYVNSFPLTTGASGLAWELLHDEMFTANYALAGHLPNKLNRMINGLWEYVTGAPVPGNASLQQATYFLEHKRTAYSTEPLPQLPHFGEGLGAFGWDGGDAWPVTDNTDPPTVGMLAWFAPYARVVSEVTLHRCSVFVDNFDNSVHWLKCTVLAMSEMQSGGFKYTPTAWEMRIYNTATGTASGWQAFSQVGTTPMLKANVAVVPYQPGAHNQFELRLRRPTGTYQFGELAIVGWDFYFEP